MGRQANHLQFDAVQAIKFAITEFGDPAGPRTAKLKYPDVTPSMWSRWTNLARAELREMDIANGMLSPASAGEHPTVADDVTPMAVDMYRHLDEMLAASKAMLEFSWVPDPSQGGRRRIRNPIAVAAAVKLRAQVLEVALKHESAVFGAERFMHWEKAMLGAVMDAIGRSRGAAEEAVSGRVIEAVRDVVARRKEEREFVSSAGFSVVASPMKLRGTKNGNA